MEQSDSDQVPPDGGAADAPDWPDPSAMIDDIEGQDPATDTSGPTGTTDPPASEPTLGEDDAYLRPAAASVGGQPVRLTLTVTGPATVTAAVDQSFVIGTIQLKISAYAARLGRRPPTRYCAKHPTNPCGSFSVRDAGQYAVKHWWRSKYNSNYRGFPQDCTNFVSQILKAGGFRDVKHGGGNEQWWYWSAPFFRSLDNWTKSWTVASDLHDHLILTRRARRVKAPRPGDIVFFRWVGRRAGWSHVGAFVGDGKKLFYTSHSNDRFKEWKIYKKKNITKRNTSAIKYLRPIATDYDT